MSERCVIVCGSSAGMWDDLAAALSCAQAAQVDWQMAALNYSGIFLDVLDHWFITRMDNVVPLRHLREAKSTSRGMQNVQTHSPGHEFFPQIAEGHTFWSVPTKGTIAMFAVKVLSSLGFRKIILAGVPLEDKSGYFFGPPWEDFGMSDESRDYWQEQASTISPYVRSVSGWTQELLGTPSVGWLRGGDNGKT